MLYVALLAEGVDRNVDGCCGYLVESWSPSSRRAWIEISSSSALSSFMVVALLAEGVDRNLLIQVECVVNLMSPSSRRAWIEIWWSGARNLS